MATEWVWSTKHNEPGKLLETKETWEHVTYSLWLPRIKAVVDLREDQVSPLGESPVLTHPQYPMYVAAAAKIAESMNQDTLISPLESSLIPLPHQIKALSRALSGDQVRYLLADEVGLGKTIEAGLIMRELKLRGLVRRILIIVPRGLVLQWVDEMKFRFGEDFRLLLPEDIEMARRLFPGGKTLNSNSDEGALPHLGESTRPVTAGPANPFTLFDQVICPLDSFKPMEGRKGWTKGDVEAYNQIRFESLVKAGWDLVIIDEAHRLGGSTDQVARHKLGKGLSEAAPHLLLLSATPHQGKTDAFLRLMSLLDAQAFLGEDTISKDKVLPYVIRTEKRKAIDLDGKPLFRPRHTRLLPIAWEETHRLQRELYEAVSDYVRKGYNQALEEKRNYIGFLLLLMQRLVTSSTRAVKDALAKRLEVLAASDREMRDVFLTLDEDWADLDGQFQLETLLNRKIAAVGSEEAQVRELLAAAAKAEERSQDAKADALLDLVYGLRRDEMDPDLKFLVFTEFVSTQNMLSEFLTQRGFDVCCLNGSMAMDQRLQAQNRFKDACQFLISTDAGGEGLNLQFCHVVVNYDIPWNPMKLEQRIGRVDRIGQAKPVQAYNFVLQDTAEYRVQEVLEEKLAVILKEFGVDKTQDVLDSAQGGRLFEEVYREAILRPESADAEIQGLLDRVRREMEASRTGLLELGSEENLDPAWARKAYDTPLQTWTERMVTSYLSSYGGRAQKNLRTWDLTWPGKETSKDVVFSSQEARENPEATHLTLEDVRVKGLVKNLPRFVPGQPIPKVHISGLAQGLVGYWSLWQIALRGQGFEKSRIMPHFLTKEGRSSVPTARFVWNALVTNGGDDLFVSPHPCREDVFLAVKESAFEEGRRVYRELAGLFERKIRAETKKGLGAFEARRKAIDRIGLANVRAHRLRQLEQEVAAWKQEMKTKSEYSPYIEALLVVKVQQWGGSRG